MDRGFYKTYFKIEKKHWLMKVRRSIVFDLLKKYKGVPTKTRVLDFGCGSGYLVLELASRGYPASGVDNSPEAIEFGRKQGIMGLSTLTPPYIDLPDHSVDAVLMLDVIEHLEDETWVLREVERILVPGGIVVITVPAFMFLWGVQDVISHHYRRYTMGTLLAVMRRVSNLKVIKKSYFNTFLFAPIACVRLISRWLKLASRESDFSIDNRLFNVIFYWIFNLERYLLRYVDFSFGVSIVLVLKKDT